MPRKISDAEIARQLLAIHAELLATNQLLALKHAKVRILRTRLITFS
jgi:hypothetical protein